MSILGTAARCVPVVYLYHKEELLCHHMYLPYGNISIAKPQWQAAPIGSCWLLASTVVAFKTLDSRRFRDVLYTLEAIEPRVLSKVRS